MLLLLLVKIKSHRLLKYTKKTNKFILTLTFKLHKKSLTEIKQLFFKT